MPFTPLIAAADAPTFAVPGVEFKGLAAPSRGAAESAVWIVTVLPGAPGVPHQLTREEVLVAFEGRARATLGGVEYELEAGSAFIVPALTGVAIANPFSEPFRAVAVLPVGGAAIVEGGTFVPPWAQ
jgi:quercetin dioxygenase-like cupin family protein